jgi:ribonuclease J
MPVHGEWRHLRANADLAISTGVPASHVVIAEDGVVVDLVEGLARITGKVPAGNVYVDANQVGGATEATLRDRRTLAEEGVVTVLAIVDADTGKLAEPPDFMVRGFVHDDRTFDAAVAVIEKTLSLAAQEGIGDAHRLEQMLGRDVARWAEKKFRRTPLIIPIVIDA